MKDSADKKDRPKQATVVCEVCEECVRRRGRCISRAPTTGRRCSGKREGWRDYTTTKSAGHGQESAEETQGLSPGVEGSTDTSRRT